MTIKVTEEEKRASVPMKTNSAKQLENYANRNIPYDTIVEELCANAIDQDSPVVNIFMGPGPGNSGHNLRVQDFGKGFVHENAEENMYQSSISEDGKHRGRYGEGTLVLFSRWMRNSDDEHYIEYYSTQKGNDYFTRILLHGRPGDYENVIAVSKVSPEVAVPLFKATYRKNLEYEDGHVIFPRGNKTGYKFGAVNIVDVQMTLCYVRETQVKKHNAKSKVDSLKDKLHVFFAHELQDGVKININNTDLKFHDYLKLKGMLKEPDTIKLLGFKAGTNGEPVFINGKDIGITAKVVLVPNKSYVGPGALNAAHCNASPQGARISRKRAVVKNKERFADLSLKKSIWPKLPEFVDLKVDIYSPGTPEADKHIQVDQHRQHVTTSKEFRDGFAPIFEGPKAVAAEKYSLRPDRGRDIAESTLAELQAYADEITKLYAPTKGQNGPKSTETIETETEETEETDRERRDPAGGKGTNPSGNGTGPPRNYTKTHEGEGGGTKKLELVHSLIEVRSVNNGYRSPAFEFKNEYDGPSHRKNILEVNLDNHETRLHHNDEKGVKIGPWVKQLIDFAWAYFLFKEDADEGEDVVQKYLGHVHDIHLRKHQEAIEKSEKTDRSQAKKRKESEEMDDAVELSEKVHEAAQIII